MSQNIIENFDQLIALEIDSIKLQVALITKYKSGTSTLAKIITREARQTLLEINERIKTFIELKKRWQSDQNQ